METFEVDKMNAAKMIISIYDGVNDIVENGENAGY